MNGGSVFDLQKFLGHTDIQMTMRYAHHSMEHLQKAIDKFSLGQQNETDIFNHSQNTSLLSIDEPKTQFNQILTSVAN